MAQQGIAEVLSAVELGADKADAYEVLAPAYSAYAAQFSRSAEESERYMERARKTYQEYLKLRPGDSESRMAFVGIVRDEDERLRELEELVRRNPKHAMGQYGLGAMLLERGNASRGAAHLLAAAEAFTPEQSGTHGFPLVEKLKQAGRKDDAKKAEKLLAARRSDR